MKYLSIILGILVLGCCSGDFCFVSEEDITNMYSSYVEEWKKECSESFNKAEKEIFPILPDPTPDDGTNPDPSKCICRGTGIIVHGDGHKTPCPHHGQSSSIKGKK